MSRPVTLFTGQWADLPRETLAEKAAGFGYDGLELACWGDHFEVDKALSDDGYIQTRKDILEKHGLQCHAISTHLVGQCVSDALIDERHRGILPDRLWGDGDPDGVRERCAEEVKDTARATAKFGVPVVNGFTGSPIWHMIYRFPPTSDDMIDEGYASFGEQWKPMMDVFQEDIKWGLEAHPPMKFIEHFPDRIYHVHVKDSKVRLDNTRSILGSHLQVGDSRRGWDFVSPGHGDLDMDEMIRALNRIGYTGPLSIEWEDSGMDREFGATESCAWVKKSDFDVSGVAFDAAFADEEA